MTASFQHKRKSVIALVCSNFCQENLRRPKHYTNQSAVWIVDVDKYSAAESAAEISDWMLMLSHSVADIKSGFPAPFFFLENAFASEFFICKMIKNHSRLLSIWSEFYITAVRWRTIIYLALCYHVSSSSKYSTQTYCHWTHCLLVT